MTCSIERGAVQTGAGTMWQTRLSRDFELWLQWLVLSLLVCGMYVVQVVLQFLSITIMFPIHPSSIPTYNPYSTHPHITPSISNPRSSYTTPHTPTPTLPTYYSHSPHTAAERGMPTPRHELRYPIQCHTGRLFFHLPHHLLGRYPHYSRAPHNLHHLTYIQVPCAFLCTGECAD